MTTGITIGQTIGRYRITEEIGRGGLAIVYQAYDPKISDYVAIQVIRPELVQDTHVIKKSKQENEILSKLQHPNILSIIDYGESQGIVYTVTRFLTSSKTLKQVIRERTLTLDEVDNTLRQIASALDYVHSREIFHRDVKPTNILIDENQNAYLVDFGISKIVSVSIPSKEEGVGIGTPEYMSPEQWAGKRVTAYSDIYSLGIVAYEMITGRLPYTADTPIAIMFKQLNDPIPLIRNLRKDVPSEAEQVIYKALSLEPKMRFSSAGDMAIAFSNAIMRAKIKSPSSKKVVVQHTRQSNPWMSGSFYLFSTVIIIVLLAIISSQIPWYVLPIVFIGGLSAVIIVGILQLRNDKNLSEKNFLTLVIETLKQLPLLNKFGSSNKSQSDDK